MHQNGNPKKQHWLERAIATHNFHIDKVKQDSKWVIEDTAKALNRSIGSISEDLLIVSWLKTHETKIKEFKYAHQALSFIRSHKRRMKTEPFN